MTWLKLNVYCFQTLVTSFLVALAALPNILHPTVPTAMDTTVSNAEAEDEQHKPTHRQILVGEIIFCMHGQSCMKSIENKKKITKISTQCTVSCAGFYLSTKLG